VAASCFVSWGPSEPTAAQLSLLNVGAGVVVGAGVGVGVGVGDESA
jgi:hypothetical protein